MCAENNVMRRAILIAVGLLITAVSVPSGTLALEFSLHPNNKSRTLTAILATGDIERGDVEKLKAFLSRTRKKKNTAIYLASPGGDLFEGTRLGLFFKERRIKTVIEGGYVCASACALAFLGGTDKSGNPWRSSSTNSRLGFHAFTDRAVGSVSSDEVQGVVAYILQYGLIVKAPTELLIAGFSTPNSDMFWVSQSDICALGIKLWSVERDAFVCNR
jgi:hypothetical protein